MAGVTADDGLGFFAVNSDAVQPVALLHLLDDPLAVAGDLVHFNDRIQTPIRDEKLVCVDNKWERMPDHPGADRLDVSAVQVGMLDMI